jgi:choline dehydrogenase-like flavoprotein
MFINAKDLTPDAAIAADVCIVGAGAAGITLAMALTDSGYTIAVFEGGGMNFDADSQNLYTGSIVGRVYAPLDRDRLRFLGGSTNHWAGSCRPFSASDLADWPIGLDALEPYYPRAHQLCQLGPYTYDVKDWASADARALEAAAGSTLRSGVFQYSPPTRFGEAYRQQLAAAKNVTVYLNANLLDIHTNEDASSVTGLQLGCLGGRRFRARARHYVLAAGGIENARILLNTTRVQKAGLGNAHDLVGRYFMDHACVPGAATVLADVSRPEVAFYEPHEVRGHFIEGYFCATDAVKQAEGLPPFSIGLREVVEQEELADFTVPKALSEHLPEDVVNSATYYATRALARLGRPAQWLTEKMWNKPPGTFTTFYSCGPAPQSESRVTLTDRLDVFGLREPQVDWRLPANFEAQMDRAHELLGQELGRSGLGRVRIESRATGHDPMQDLFNGHHHMGTTRMHDDPRQGVVDQDCRIHGLGNLFVAGSSVFTSYACDDPTMTICALALRLSDRLKRALA